MSVGSTAAPFTTNVRRLWPDRGVILSSNAAHFKFM